MPPVIPEFITVHLGSPNSNAQNVTVSFPDYIKNVASSEIYPTWPENAIRANIYAQLSFALNRYYTEFYRSQGYDFDITNDTQFDQFYVPERNIFESISRIVDDIFDSYVQRQGAVEPLFTAYCNGTTVTCEGLSQWGTVPLANQGLIPYEILQSFYGDDINIVTDVPIGANVPSFQGINYSLGMAGNDVKSIQIKLNRISNNYPAIPKIHPVDGVFGPETEDAVKEFQRIFNLGQDGVVGRSTWYRINYIYNSVKRLSELDSEGITLQEVQRQYPELLQLGDTGLPVQVITYYLAVIGAFYNALPQIEVKDTFDEQVREAVIAFQKAYGLTPDGIVGAQTWNEIYRAYLGIIEDEENLKGGVRLFPGRVIRIGSSGQDVVILQQYLSYIADTYPEIPKLPATGFFGQQTQNAVRQYQTLFGLEPTGIVGAVTWNSIAGTYSDLTLGYSKQPGQFPGYTLKENY